MRTTVLIGRSYGGEIAVGDEGWESFPTELKEMFIGNGPAILAELRGGPLHITAQELGEIDQPTLIVSAQNSPEAFRRVDGVLAAEVLPNCETVVVEVGHFISPAHPAVLEFVDRILTVPVSRAWVGSSPNTI